ncbi:MAG: hypothetical protein KME30_10925 [Iphinoe sp. HA4291-MV1]|jgi:hypothetical protein|nr:hypothetical protein [Iphinoe sp. HA4291-MV1]
MQQVLMSTEEKEALYYCELVRYGIDFKEALTVAKILASEKPDELLTEEEKKLVTEVCKLWIVKHKHFKHLNPYLMKYKNFN